MASQMAPGLLQAGHKGGALLGKIARRWASSVVFLVILGIVVGYLLFAFPLGGVPQVALVEGPNDVIDADVARQMAAKLRLATDDPRVKAVVIQVDSPGGLASASEDLYTNVLHLREKKPVVVMVDSLAASGAYFMSAAANHIVAKGSSIVGNVGAILVLPRRAPPSEYQISTGPFKLTGGSERTYIKLLELLKDGFAEAVISQRQPPRLRLSRDELLEGRVYLGIEALQLGLVDQLGTQVDAVREAARLAGLRRYQVVQLEQKYRDHPLLLSERAPEKPAPAQNQDKAAPTNQEKIAPQQPTSPPRKRDLADLPEEFPFVYYLFVPP